MLALRMIGRRAALSLISLLLVSLFIFVMVEALPGDAATRYLGRMATEEQKALLRTRLNLDTPAPQRYAQWLAGIVRLDFGNTMVVSRPIRDVLAPKIANTLILAGAAFLLYLPLSLIPAAIQALNRDRGVDHAFSVLTLVLLSTPDFLLGTLLLLLFVVTFPLLPAMSVVDDATTFTEFMRALVLPALTLGLVMSVYAVRFLRDGLIEVLDSEYIRMAELNGLPRRTILLRHALPNAMIPTLNVTALNIAYMMGGVVIVERVFGFPGFGSLTVDAMLTLDVPLIEATVLIAAAVYIGANLLADIGAVLLNPRLRTLSE